MTDPRPLFTMQDGPEGPVARDLGVVRRNRAWLSDERVASYWAIRRRAAEARSRPARRLRWFAAGGALATAVVLALLAVPRLADLGTRGSPLAPDADSSPRAGEASPWTALEVPGLGTLEVSRSAGLEVAEGEVERQLRIGEGVLRAQIAHQDPDRPVVVVTPHLRIIVVGTRFDVIVDARKTTVQLIEGLIRVTPVGGGVSVFVAAGESLDSDDPRLALANPEALTAAPPNPGAPARSAAPLDEAPAPALRRPMQFTMEACEARPSLEAKERCLMRLSNGGGVAAQNALFALAMLAAAQPDGAEEGLEYFARYERQYPEGPLAAEAALKQIELLRRLGRTHDAQAVAGHFAEKFADDPRVTGVMVLRGQLLCRQPQRAAEFDAVVEQLSMRTEPAAQKAAQELRARCSPRAAPAEPQPFDSFLPIRKSTSD